MDNGEKQSAKQSVYAPLESLIPNMKPILSDSTIKEHDGVAAMNTPRSDVLLSAYRINHKMIDFFRLFDSQIVVDIGAGTDPNGYLLSSFSGAKSYIGVDRFHADYLQRSSRDWHHLELDNVLPASFAAADALVFLQAVPDRSISIFTSGLDECIIQDRRYAADVAREMQRVLHPDGAYIEFDSVFGSHFPASFKESCADENPVLNEILSFACRLKAYRPPQSVEAQRCQTHQRIEDTTSESM